MQKTYDHTQHESNIYKRWEKAGAFNPDTQANADNTKKPYTILLPPPNANASLHAGHAMYVIEDILIRYHRMLGQPTVWIPGTDHAGFETQYVYEKHLAKKKQSRFQFDRENLYQQIYDFVQENSGTIFDQLKALGFSCDWSRSTFMLDDKVINIVYNTFQKMVKDGLVYRDNYIVNYSPKSGTTFSDLEVKYVERQDPFYYIRYSEDPDIVIATVRPETKFRDIALACHPDDPRYKHLIGKTVKVKSLLGEKDMTVYSDEEIDMEFGTGIMKVTPAHDAHDFQLGRKYDIPADPIIDFAGKMDFSWYLDSRVDNEGNFIGNPSDEERKYIERAKKYHGKKVRIARELIVEDMKAEGMIVDEDKNYTHNVAVDYKTGADIEPMVMPNWFVATKKLAAPAIKAAKEKKVKFFPARFEKTYYQWMENIRDWPISRQIVWGIRIPIWYSVTKNPDISVTFLNKNKERVVGQVGALLKTYTFAEIKSGLQTLTAPIEAEYVVSDKSPGDDFLPETDTFDTWFSSGQWPLTTLNYPNGEDFKKYYPTQVLDTMWDILFFWVARMIMFGLYLTNEVPFSTVFLHSMVTDAKGAKMSKSKGNVVNPLELVEKYGADALRMSLVIGSAPGNSTALAETKVKGMRNFSNKVWNAARFVITNQEARNKRQDTNSSVEFNKKLNTIVETVDKQLKDLKLGLAAEAVHNEFWHWFCDVCIEDAKQGRLDWKDLTAGLIAFLRLLHPFMPFVTESVWQELQNQPGFEELKKEYGEMLITAPWPTV